jgi:hypothetical protein
MPVRLAPLITKLNPLHRLYPFTQMAVKAEDIRQESGVSYDVRRTEESGPTADC